MNSILVPQLQVVAILQLLGAQDRLLIIFTNDDRRWPHDVPVRSYGVNAIGRHRSTEGPSGLQNNVNSYHIGGCPSVGWPTNQGKKTLAPAGEPGGGILTVFPRACQLGCEGIVLVGWWVNSPS